MAANPDIQKALEEAEKLVADLKSFDGSAKQHLAILKQTDKVRTTLESPYDTVIRLFENMTVSGALYALLGMKALQKLPEDGSTISATELAAATNVDVSAITRSMRAIVWAGIAVEAEFDVYAHNPLSQAMLPLNLGGFFNVCMDFARTWVVLPDYFKVHKPEDLYDQKKSPFAFMRGKEGLTYYEVIALDEEERHLWNITMQRIEKNMPVLGMFPFDSLKEQVEKEPDRPFIVDVAGGRGQDLLAIQTQCPGAFGSKFILQDLPIVINSLKPDEIKGIETMTYNFHTPQPVKNAHVYLFRRVMHDYYTPVCIDILKNTVPAMGPDSRLVICDMLLPERVEVGGAMEPYWLDLSLLCISGKERTLKEFEEIFEIVGLELVKVYPSDINRVVMLETRRKRE